MKIEIGESLMQSYLKHKKGCLITQTNWKTLRSWKKSNKNEAKEKFEEVKNRVLKKMIRAYLIWKIYFSNYSCKIIFASPKVNPSPDELIKKCFDELKDKKFYEKEKVGFKYFSNEEFSNEILLPTLGTLISDSDTSELFLKSAKLLKICGIIKSKNKFDN